MDPETKKTALRMIPYGLYVLTAQDAEGKAGAATVNWVTQVSFEPPLVVVGVRVDSSIHGVIKQAGAFALNMLGKGQEELATVFFKPTQIEGQKIGGEPFQSGQTGAPILESTPAYVDCRLVGNFEQGDHAIMVGEVVDAGLRFQPKGRPDQAILRLEDLGEKVFYGG
jgi:flavin reductase (DIM6/NTAB) family NADH-FMN oxidoreductase RutF